jgi:plastocyanin
MFLLTASCGGSVASTSAGGAVIVQGPDDPSLPYGITAIDYHFHDAHPSIPLDPSRTVVWVNDGRVRHNVTFPELDFSKDLPVGGSLQIRRLGDKLGGAGTYTFFCKYHDVLGMTGVIVIANPSASASP